MKPETILQSDLLDIIFLNRNHAYGAYNLRKYYNMRLTKAVALMSAIVLSLSMSWFMYANSATYTRRNPILLTPDVHIDPIAAKPVKDVPKPKTIVKPRSVAEASYTAFRIVPNDAIVKPAATVDDLANKQIALIDKMGDAVNPGDLLPASEGVPGGTGISITPVKTLIEEPIKPTTTPDVMPEFPGGKEAFMKFMLRNLREPGELEEGQKVVVIVKFIVAADGTISDTEIMQSGGMYDADVLRVVKKMPRWKPGFQNGRSVPVYFKLPVTFQNGN